MAKIPHKSAEELQRALMRFGDTAFCICYMHTKSPKETRTLMEDIFTQYFLHVKPFKDAEDERLWVLQTTHRTCMDYYAAKLRKKPTAEQIRTAGQHLDFIVSDELCTIMNLPYQQLTPLALCCGEGESEAFAAKVIGRPVTAVQKYRKAAAEKSGLPESELTEWIETITLSDDLRFRVQYAIINASKDKHFAINSRAAKLKRSVDRSLPYVALGVIVFCLFCVYAVRSGMFGYEYIRSGEGGSAVIQLDEEISRVNSEAITTPDTEDSQPGITLGLSYYVPDGEAFIQYNCTMEANAILLMEKMAEKGAFPTDVVLRDLLLIKNGKVVESLKSGEQLQVRLLFTENLQAALDADTHPEATLEAIARNMYAFYDAANLTLSSLEIYAGDSAVTIGGETVNCTALLHGTREVTDIIDE